MLSTHVKINVIVTQNEQYQDPESKLAKGDLAITEVSSYASISFFFF